MEQLKKTLSDLQNDTIKVMQCLSRLLMSESMSSNIVGRRVEEYLGELENLCVKSRNILGGYCCQDFDYSNKKVNEIVSDIAGEIDITHDGWLKITLNTLLPNCKYKISNYISDTINRLIENYGDNLPYFETAFMAIVEYCNEENHNALDNDNKGWKMIPNALKGRVIEDDNQFILSMGLFTKISDEMRCEIYIMPQDEGVIFMDLLAKDML